MKTALQVENNIYEFGRIHQDEFNKKESIITDWMWREFLKGGHGTMIEHLVLKYFIEELYTNIKLPEVEGGVSDCSLTNDNSVKLEIRRLSPDDTANLNHTSGGLAKGKWENKAKKLENGGYIFVKVLKDSFFLFYIPAKLLLNSDYEFKNEVSLKKFHKCFGRKFDFIFDKFWNL